MHKPAKMCNFGRNWTVGLVSGPAKESKLCGFGPVWMLGFVRGPENRPRYAISGGTGRLDFPGRHNCT
eukprot:7947726-Lingulodinium_polyedra.AAC.1